MFESFPSEVGSISNLETLYVKYYYIYVCNEIIKKNLKFLFFNIP